MHIIGHRSMIRWRWGSSQGKDQLGVRKLVYLDDGSFDSGTRCLDGLLIIRLHRPRLCNKSGGPRLPRQQRRERWGHCVAFWASIPDPAKRACRGLPTEIDQRRLHVPLHWQADRRHRVRLFRRAGQSSNLLSCWGDWRLDRSADADAAW